MTLSENIECDEKQIIDRVATLLEEETKFREENPHLYSTEDYQENQPTYNPTAENLDSGNQSKTYDRTRGAAPQMCTTRPEDISGRGHIIIGGQELRRMRRGGGRTIEQRQQHKSKDDSKKTADGSGNTGSARVPNNDSISASRDSTAVDTRDPWREQFDCPGDCLP